jgi:threonine dehydratase
VTARVIGVQPEASPFVYAHYTGQRREEVVERPTIADGLAGDVEEGAVTLELVDELVDEMRSVSEDEIRAALGWSVAELGEGIEPSAAAAVAAWRRDPSPGWSAVVLSGGNVDPAATGA